MNSGLQSSAPRRLYLACAIAAAIFLAYCALLTAKSVQGFPTTQVTQHHWPWLGAKPVGEDGFYMLTVADNFAITHHLVYTFNMPATGIQPLSTVVFAGIAVVTNDLGGDRWTLIRAVLFFGCVLFVLFAWMLARFASSLAPPERRTLVFALAFFLVLCDLSLFRLFTYGLETGIYLVAMLSCLVIWHRIVSETRATWRDIALLGIAGGFTGLARIDFGLIFAILLAFLLWKRFASFLQVIAAGVLAFVITSPWFLFVHSVSGAWLPSSGKAESHFITAAEMIRVTTMAAVVLGHLVPWSYVAANTVPVLLFSVGSLILIVCVWIKSPDLRAALKPGGSLRNTFVPWALALALLVVIYLLLFWSTHFYERYLSPIVLVSIPLIALGLSEQRFVARRPVVVLVLLAVLFCAWDVPSLHTGRVGNNFLVNAGYIQRTFPNARVGAFQSGTIAYFNSNVENLDGKLNQGALRATQTDSLAQFIDAEGIDVLFDSPGYIHNHLPSEYLDHNWQTCTATLPIEGWLCLTRKGSPASK